MESIEPLSKPGTKSKWPTFPTYYDKPEGQDLLGKMIHTNRYAFIVGTAFGLQDVILYSKNLRGFQPHFGRFLWYVGPAVGMATAWTFVTYISTRIRGKDDTWNYIIGAYAAGGVLGTWQRSKLWGWGMGTAFALAGSLKKASLNEGWTFFSDPSTWRQEQGDFRRHAHDWTLCAEGEKGWIAGTRSGDKPAKN